MALLLCVILLLMAFAYISRRATQYREAASVGPASQARAIAEAGLVDARQKLHKDLNFPPPTADNETVYGYHESFSDCSGNALGSYSVVINTTLAKAPYSIITITSEGRVENSYGVPIARRTLYAELLAQPQTVTSDGYRLINLEDRGGL